MLSLSYILSYILYHKADDMEKHHCLLTILMAIAHVAMYVWNTAG